MKKDKVVAVQKYLAEEGIIASETAIVDAAIDVVYGDGGGLDLLKLILLKKQREKEQQKYVKNRHLGRRDNV